MVIRRFKKRGITKRLSLVVVATVVSAFSLLSMVPPKAYAYTSDYSVQKNTFTVGVSQPSQVVVKGDAQYVAAYGTSAVYKIQNGVTTVVAGIPGQGGHSPDGSVAAQSTLTGPTSIAVNDAGEVFIAEAVSRRVRKVGLDGLLTTVAGNGLEGPRSDAAVASETSFRDPRYIRLGNDGLLYVYDGGVIRRINADGSTDRVVGKFDVDLNSDPFVEGGVATEHGFYWPSGSGGCGPFWLSSVKFDFDSSGRMFIFACGLMLRLDLDGTIHTIYNSGMATSDSTDPVPLAEKRLYSETVTGFAVDDDDRIWLTNKLSSHYYMIYVEDGVAYTAAGGGTIQPPAMGPAARFSGLFSLDTAADGSVHFIESGFGSYVGRLSIGSDVTPPQVSYTLSSEPNQFGWHNAPVALDWTVSDPESGVLSSSGCEDITVSNDSAETYTCSAISQGGSASGNVSISYDATAPTTGELVWSQNPKPVSGSTTLTLPVADNFAGVAGGEYFLGDSDPGQGNGAAMDWDGTNLSASFGDDFPTGVYKVSVRAQDAAGNWNEPVSDYLVVYNPDGFRMTGRRAVLPSLANGDMLPGLVASGQNDKATFGFSVRYNNQGQISNNSDLQFKYKTGTHCNNPNQASNCHSLELNATTIYWLTTQGQNDSTGIFQGAANMVVDGLTSQVVFRVTGLDGERFDPVSADRFQIEIYPQGAIPGVNAPIYRVNATDIARGNIKIL